MIRRSLADQLIITGLPGYIGVILFLSGLVLAWRIHSRGVGIRQRAAFLAFSFLPALIGIFTGSSRCITYLNYMAKYVPGPEHGHAVPLSFEVATAENLIIVVWTSVESLTLVVISLLLFLGMGGERGGGASSFSSHS